MFCEPNLHIEPDWLLYVMTSEHLRVTCSLLKSVSFNRNLTNAPLSTHQRRTQLEMYLHTQKHQDDDDT